MIVAYDIRGYQLDAPAWMEQESFDIVAKIPSGATKSDVPLMLQQLLEERFGLKVRHELKPAPSYGLTVGKRGLRMKEYEMVLPEGFVEAAPSRLAGVDKEGLPIIPPGYATGMMISQNGQTGIAIARQPIASLCRLLSGILQRPVVDQTGLTGRYDVRLSFVTDDAPPATGPNTENTQVGVSRASDSAPALMDALLAQLGLSLESKVLPIDFLVVDHAEKQPSEN